MVAFMSLMNLSNLKTFIVRRGQHARAVAKWAAILIPMSACVGSLCALFLWSLDLVTQTRFAHPELLFALPLAGLAVGLLYHHFGRDAEAGNNLILEQLHTPGDGVPLRMAPLILISTVTTHLFGGSAGREGTAVQMGGSIASAFAKLFRFGQDSARLLLMAGVAAGFGAVFGTPVAGAVFALEFITLGRMQYDALIPCLAAAIFGDLFCKAWGVHHVAYHVAVVSGGAGAPLLLAKAAIAGVAFGLTSLLFSETQHRSSAAFKAAIPYAPLRPFVGGLIVIGLAYAFHGQAYLGLGVVAQDPAAPSIVHFFSSQTPDYVSWMWKILFTVVTLGSGFKGGEVTPLFFIGAALGAALSFVLGAPTDLFAALGFVAVFAGASNTPIACSLMGVELFGGDVALPAAVACFTAYLASGHTGIYLSQRLGAAKSDPYRLAAGQSLRQLRTAVPVKPTAEAP